MFSPIKTFSRKPCSHISGYLRALRAASHGGLDSSFQVNHRPLSKKHRASFIIFSLSDGHMSLKQVARILGRRLNLPVEPQLSSLALHLRGFISLHPHKKHLGDNETGADRSAIACSRPNCSSHSHFSLASASYCRWIPSLQIHSKREKMKALETPSQIW